MICYVCRLLRFFILTAKWWWHFVISIEVRIIPPTQLKYV